MRSACCRAYVGEMDPEYRELDFHVAGPRDLEEIGWEIEDRLGIRLVGMPQSSVHGAMVAQIGSESSHITVLLYTAPGASPEGIKYEVHNLTDGDERLLRSIIDEARIRPRTWQGRYSGRFVTTFLPSVGL